MATQPPPPAAQTAFAFDLRPIKRIEYFFQTPHYVRTVLTTLVGLVVYAFYPEPMIPWLIAAQFAAFGLLGVVLRAMPDAAHRWQVIVVAVMIVVKELPYLAAVLYLWAFPDTAVRCVSIFAISIAMLDSIFAQRHDSLLVWCRVIGVALASMAMPLISLVVHDDPREAIIMSFVTGGSFLYYVYSLTDVLRTKEALVRAQHQDAERGRIEALGRLTGGVAHDFNNLLTVISGNLDLMREIDDPVERLALAQEVEMAAARAAQVTSRLLAYSRRATLHPAVIPFSSIIAPMQALLRRLLPAGIDISFDVPLGLPSLRVDQSALETVMLNLCLNARAALRYGGRIEVAARCVTAQAGQFRNNAGALPAADYVVITLRDNGVGIAPDVMARIYEPYFTTKPPGQGSGLGLAMAVGFAEQSGGTLGLTSTPGVGTVATLVLPADAGSVGRGGLNRRRADLGV